MSCRALLLTSARKCFRASPPNFPLDLVPSVSMKRVPQRVAVRVDQQQCWWMANSFIRTLRLKVCPSTPRSEPQPSGFPRRAVGAAWDFLRYATLRFGQKLRWRVSRGARRSLRWVPMKAASLKRKGNALRFRGKTFRVFERERLDGVRWQQGCFAQDAVGEWWLCLPVKVTEELTVAAKETVCAWLSS